MLDLEVRLYYHKPIQWYPVVYLEGVVGSTNNEDWLGLFSSYAVYSGSTDYRSKTSRRVYYVVCVPFILSVRTVWMVSVELIDWEFTPVISLLTSRGYLIFQVVVSFITVWFFYRRAS
ncbi:unnamed protein product (mitochondrion) [Enteromyxum leei]|uniref:Transmembrane protein n=1 Tax=Enteromyxum leei TaxID=188704 RepID=A0A1Y6KTX7_ENTLE|nr:unnamed protein product [Enteromyxum leei]